MSVVDPVSQIARQDVRRGAVDCAPLAVGVAIYGLAFGLLAAQAGMSGLNVGVMGATVFAGASQIVTVERTIAGGGAIAAAVAGLVLNLRLLLVTASIRDIYVGRPWWQIALGAHLATDENWARMMGRRAEGQDVGYWYLVGGGLVLVVAWLASTITGAVLASEIPNPRALGMDFAFTAAFIAITRSLWRGRTSLLPWFASVVAVTGILATGAIDPTWALIAGGVIGAATAAIQPAAKA